MFKIILTKPKHICQAYRCKSLKGSKDRFCSKHRKRMSKENDLVAYTYYILQSNARRRKKEFVLTLEEFRDFCKETNYIELKGRFGKCMSIDRKNPNKGYSKDNIQIMSVSNNCAKQHSDKKIDYEKDDLPF